jgi:hypothetical protein
MAMCPGETLISSSSRKKINMTMDVTDRAVSLCRELLKLPDPDNHALWNLARNYGDDRLREILSDSQTRGYIWFGIVKKRWPDARTGKWILDSWTVNRGDQGGYFLAHEKTELEAILAAAIVVRSEENRKADDEVPTFTPCNDLDAHLLPKLESYIAKLPEAIRRGTDSTHSIRAAMGIINRLVVKRDATITEANKVLNDDAEDHVPCTSTYDVVERLRGSLAAARGWRGRWCKENENLDAVTADFALRRKRLEAERDEAVADCLQTSEWMLEARVERDTVQQTANRLRRERDNVGEKYKKVLSERKLWEEAKRMFVESESRRTVIEHKYQVLAAEKIEAMLDGTRALLDALEVDDVEAGLARIVAMDVKAPDEPQSKK